MNSDVSFARECLEKAVHRIFDADVRVQAVGIASDSESGVYFGAIRNVEKIVPQSAPTKTLRSIHEIPIRYIDSHSDIESTLQLPAKGPGSPVESSFISEQDSHLPLTLGLQIQNFDHDERERTSGRIPSGVMTVGTLGCFVKFLNEKGRRGLLSNNHVIAGENNGKISNDRILQPGSLGFRGPQHIASLTNFVHLKTSNRSALPSKGNVKYNESDAACAEIEENVAFTVGFLPKYSSLPAIKGTDDPKINDNVFKVGRTTGLTRGKIISSSAVVGPVLYSIGECWFRNSFLIIGENDCLFSDKGDSGSAIIRDDGYILGLLYAGNGSQTFACPISSALNELDCEISLRGIS